MKTPSQLESMVQEAKLLREIVEEESDACELIERRFCCREETADLGRVIPRCKFGSDAFCESGSLPIVPMMQSACHRLRFDDTRIRVLDRSRLGTILHESKMGPILIIELTPEREVFQGKRTVRPQR